MENSDIKKVIELTKWNAVNDYLDLGWRIIKTYTTAYSDFGPLVNDQTLHYALGWDKNDPPKYPEPPEWKRRIKHNDD